MRRALAAVAAASSAALVLAQGGSAGPGGLALPANVVRAEIVVLEGGVVHDYRVDRGTLRAVAAGSVTLLERDGTTVTVPVSPSARVLLRGRAVRFARLNRMLGRVVTTIRDRDAPASLVRVGL
jgi:hypothetical protein